MLVLNRTTILLKHDRKLLILVVRGVFGRRCLVRESLDVGANDLEEYILGCFFHVDSQVERLAHDIKLSKF